MTSLEAGFPTHEHLVRLDRGRGRAGVGQRWNDAVARSPSQAEPALWRHRLLFCLALINLLAFSLFAAAIVKGWVGNVVAADATHLILVIFGVFAVGLAMSAHRLWRTARAPRRDDSSFAGHTLREEGGVAADVGSREDAEGEAGSPPGSLVDICA